MRINTGRKWQDLGPRRGEALGAPSLQLRDGEITGSIDSTIITAKNPDRGRPHLTVRADRGTVKA